MLGGRYEVGAPLGIGGTSSVFRAWDTRLELPVATKLLHPHLVAVPEDLERFEEEGRIGARLRHPRLVSVLDGGRDGAVVWLVLELVEGATLAELIRQGGPPAERDALAALRAVLTALGHVHAVGLLHLDVSANNVMVDDGPHGPQWSAARVLDVGGRPFDTPVQSAGAIEGEAPGLVRASPGFASPEIATGQPAGPRADLYSAGALLHVLLTGAPPFERSDPRELLEAQVSLPVPRPSDLVPGIDADLDAIVLRAMHKDPARRYGSAAEMAADVDLAVGARTPGTASARTGVLRQASGHPGAVSGTTLRHEPVAPLPRGTARTEAVPSGRTAQAGALAALLLVPAVVAAVAFGWPDDAAAPASAVVVIPTSTPAASATVKQSPTSQAPVPPEPPAPVQVQVPELGGLLVEEVGAALEAIGLNLGSRTERDGPAVGGRVLESAPAAGQELDPGSSVDVVLSSGQTSVPDVSGLDAPSAQALLLDAGLEMVQMTSTGGSALVLATVPEHGTRVPVGASVLLRYDGVPTRPSGPGSTPTPSPGPASRPTPGGSPSPTSSTSSGPAD